MNCLTPQHGLAGSLTVLCHQEQFGQLTPILSGSNKTDQVKTINFKLYNYAKIKTKKGPQKEGPS